MSAPYVQRRVKVIGTSRVDVNGQEGIAIGFDKTKGKYHVQMESGAIFILKPENLEPTGPAKPTGSADLDNEISNEIKHTVPIRKQQTDNTCWAACGLMVLDWAFGERGGQVAFNEQQFAKSVNVDYGDMGDVSVMCAGINRYRNKVTNVKNPKLASSFVVSQTALWDHLSEGPVIVNLKQGGAPGHFVLLTGKYILNGNNRMIYVHNPQMDEGYTLTSLVKLFMSIDNQVIVAKPIH